jgi:Super-infection exclusion protein B
MMTKNTHRFPDGAKIAARFSPAIVALISGTLLFGPAALLARLGLGATVENHRQPIGTACLVSMATLLIAQVLPWTFGALGPRWRQSSQRRKGKQRLSDLTRSEKNILNQYISRDTRTLMLDGKSGTTAALQHAGIIYQAEDLNETAAGLAFHIQPWAWRHLQNNRHVLENAGSPTQRLSEWRTRRRS